MKRVRLLPVVIFAAVALLLFKGIGLVTEGGYVLSGVTPSVASQPAPSPTPAAGAPAAATEPTMTDTAPTLTDTAPTLTLPAAGGAAAGGAHGAPAPEAVAANGATPAPGAGAAAGSKPAPAAGNAAAPASAGANPTGAGAACPPSAPGAAPAAAPAAAHGAAPASGAAPAAGSAPCATSMTDAVPMRVDSNGKYTPLAAADGRPLTEQILLQRLAERRAQLDKREADLAQREAIVAVAEKQMADRAAQLKQLEAQISALSAQKNSMQDTQFAALVSMYENMKPQDAAGIFDGLDMSVLLRVAKAMSPRKMSPILAKMTAAKAEQLTTQMASGDPATVTAAMPTAGSPGALPQIVGH